MHMAHSIHADQTLAHLKNNEITERRFICLFVCLLPMRPLSQLTKICNKSSQKALIPNSHPSPSILPHARGAQGVEAAKHQRAVEKELHFSSNSVAVLTGARHPHL